MARQRHLRKAPIREAIIDLKIAPAVDLGKLTPVFESLKAQFPSQEQVRESTFGFEADADGVRSKAIDRGIRGCRLASADGKYVVLMRVDGFTFSRLPPYETWEKMDTEAKPIWENFLSRSGAERVTRAAVRYINLLELPLPVADFREYLTAAPEIPPSLPQQTGGFFSRMILPGPDFDGAAVLTQALEMAVADKAQIILDIDVFREVKDRDWFANDDSVWATLEKMRHFKNLVFFESITEKTAELYQ